MVLLDKLPCVSASLCSTLVDIKIYGNCNCFVYGRLDEQFGSVQLKDLRVITTLGVGGFGRVELVAMAGDGARSFALKQMKKSQVSGRVCHITYIHSATKLSSLAVSNKRSFLLFFK
jgi:hypothetical protein